MSLTVSTSSAPNSLRRIFAPPVGDRCVRCTQRVYQVEKVGPVNEVVFHRQCFRCSECGHHLSLKTYFTNQTDFGDKEIYCQTHCPRVSAHGYDARAMGMRSVMSAPTRGGLHNDLIRGTGEAPRIDSDSMHIREALSAQSDFRRKYMTKYDRHHFPAYLVTKTKEKLYKYQEELERQQREEEDRMMKAFQEERRLEAENMEKELNAEWESQLKQLTAKFDAKSGDKKERDPKATERYERELTEMRKTMTMKTLSRKQAMTMKLQMKNQLETATLVKEHSRQMLDMLQAKQEELKKELEEEIRANGGSESDAGQEFIDGVMSTITLSPTDIPHPHPPQLRKRDLYHDPTVFEELDADVFQVAEGEQGSFTELVRQLTAHCLSDLQKARAIFRWITVKDLSAMEFDETIQQDTPLGLLRGIKFGTETYHTLFMRLCSYAGLACQEVRGHSKSVGYEPGVKILEDTFQNTWNVVLVLGDWWPVQCNWGARHLVLNKDQPTNTGDSNIRYQYDEHYFLTDPDEFIQEFWARDPEWQLLDRPITLEEFEALPFVRSVFFHHGLELAEPYKAVLIASAKGGAEVRVNVPEEDADDLVFHYQLRFADRKRRGEVEAASGAKLERFVFQTAGEGWVLFSVHVPEPGEYLLEIFCSRIEEGTGSAIQLKCAAKFRIQCVELTGKMHPLPGCAAGEWGPAKGRRHFDLDPVTHSGGVINVADRAEIRFRVKRPLVFHCRLRHNDTPDQDSSGGGLDQLVDHEVDGGILTIRVSFPAAGQYGLDVYARPEESEDVQTMAHALKYLINCTAITSPPETTTTTTTSSSISSSSSSTSSSSASGTLTSQDRVPPQIERQPSPLPPVQTGPTPAFNGLGLKTVSHREPVIDKLDKGGNVTIEISCSSDSLVLTAQLFRNLDEEWHSRVTAKKASKKYKFSVALPKEGQYRLLIFAGKRDEPQNMAAAVYTYTINYETAEETRKKKGLFGK